VDCDTVHWLRVLRYAGRRLQANSSRRGRPGA
jgi:hypothetical protein